MRPRVVLRVSHNTSALRGAGCQVKNGEGKGLRFSRCHQGQRSTGKIFKSELGVRYGRYGRYGRCGKHQSTVVYQWCPLSDLRMRDVKRNESLAARAQQCQETDALTEESRDGTDGQQGFSSRHRGALRERRRLRERESERARERESERARERERERGSFSFCWCIVRPASSSKSVKCVNGWD